MDKVCEELKKILGIIKKDKDSFGDGFHRNDFDFARQFCPYIVERIRDLKARLPGEIFLKNLIRKKAIRFEYEGQERNFSVPIIGPIRPTEQKIRQVIVVYENVIELNVKKLGDDAVVILESGATFLPANLNVVGSLNLKDSEITELPEHLNVSGDLILNSKIKDLPDSLRVGGDLAINARPFSVTDVVKKARKLKKLGRIGGDILL